jgi:hypothetical protein
MNEIGSLLSGPLMLRSYQLSVQSSNADPRVRI